MCGLWQLLIPARCSFGQLNLSNYSITSFASCNTVTWSHVQCIMLASLATTCWLSLGTSRVKSQVGVTASTGTYRDISREQLLWSQDMPVHSVHMHVERPIELIRREEAMSACNDALRHWVMRVRWGRYARAIWFDPALARAASPGARRPAVSFLSDARLTIKYHESGDGEDWGGDVKVTVGDCVRSSSLSRQFRPNFLQLHQR